MDWAYSCRTSGSHFKGKALIWCWGEGRHKETCKSDNSLEYFWEGRHKEMTKEPFGMGKATMAAAMFWRAQPATGTSERGGSGLA